MRKGTTPTFRIKLNNAQIANMKTIYVEFKQGDVEIVKSGTELTIQDDILLVKLSQEETLRFKHGINVRVQVRAVQLDGTAVASNIKTIDVKEILQDGVII